MQRTERLRTEERPVSGFDRVRLNGMGELTITQGDDEGLTIEAEESILPLIETEVRDERLTIGYWRQMGGLRPTLPIQFALRLRRLSVLVISGSGGVRSHSILAERMEVLITGSGSVHLDELMASWLGTTISGSGSFQVAGEAAEHRVEISGSGGLHAPNLRTHHAEVTVSGSGAATVDVAEKLAVVISGSGGVAYSGVADVSQRTSGSGRVRAK